VVIGYRQHTLQNRLRETRVCTSCRDALADVQAHVARNPRLRTDRRHSRTGDDWCHSASANTVDAALHRACG
jgi:hypothetical protein